MMFREGKPQGPPPQSERDHFICCTSCGNMLDTSAMCSTICTGRRSRKSPRRIDEDRTWHAPAVTAPTGFARTIPNALGTGQRPAAAAALATLPGLQRCRARRDAAAARI